MQKPTSTRRPVRSAMRCRLLIPAATPLQIMDTDSVEMDENGEPMEAVLSSGRLHANLVATIAW